MKKIITLIVIALLVIPKISDARKKLSLITDPFPPLYYQENGVNKGFYCELLDLAFKEMKTPYKLSFMPWSRALLMAKKRMSDGVPGTAKTKERMRFLIFPEEPLSVIDIVLFHRKEDNFQYNDISSLKDKRIGITQGYSYGEAFDQNKLCIKEEVGSLNLNFLKLKAKRLDLVVAYKDVALIVLQEMNLTDEFSFNSNPIHQSALYLAFSKKPGHTTLAKKFSRALHKVKASDKGKLILQKAGYTTIAPLNKH